MMHAVTETVRRQVEDLVSEWARRIDEDRLEELADLLTENGVYRIASRFNLDRGLPLSIVHCRGRAQLRDRIVSLRLANVYEAHFYRHILSGVQVIGERDGVLEVRANYLVARIMEHDGVTSIFSTGQYRDRVVIEAGQARFAERVVVFDSKAIDTLLAIPL
jgi:anthranilate 1,2-dioxygenase small subunit